MKLNFCHWYHPACLWYSSTSHCCSFLFIVCRFLSHFFRFVCQTYQDYRAGTPLSITTITLLFHTLQEVEWLRTPDTQVSPKQIGREWLEKSVQERVITYSKEFKFRRNENKAESTKMMCKVKIDLCELIHMYSYVTVCTFCALNLLFYSMKGASVWLDIFSSVPSSFFAVKDQKQKKCITISSTIVVVAVAACSTPPMRS